MNTIRVSLPATILLGLGSLVSAQTSAQTVSSLSQSSSAGNASMSMKGDASGWAFTLKNGNAGGDPNLAARIQFLMTTDGSNTNPTFSDEVGLYLNFKAPNGQNDQDGTAKKTYSSFINGAGYQGAGQRFTQINNINCSGMGDCFVSSDQLTTGAGVYGSGDEGNGYRTMNLEQPMILETGAISSVFGNTTASTNATQEIAPDRRAHPIAVVSSTGFSAGHWIVVDANKPSTEAVLLTAAGPGSLTGVFIHAHAAGARITPAVVLNADLAAGQFRTIVNNTAPSYTTGKIRAIDDRVVSGSGTAWTESMVGGSPANPGCISFDADTTSPRGSPIRAWYPIVNVDSKLQQISIRHIARSGDASYSGKGPGSGGYRISPCAKAMYVSGTLVLESNSFAWRRGDQLENSISVDGDFTAENMRVGSYLPGATYRAIYDATNNGLAQWGAAYRVQSNSTSGGYDSGFDASGASTRVGIRLPGAGTGGTSSVAAIAMTPSKDGNHNGMITWFGPSIEVTSRGMALTDNSNTLTLGTSAFGGTMQKTLTILGDNAVAPMLAVQNTYYGGTTSIKESSLGVPAALLFRSDFGAGSRWFSSWMFGNGHQGEFLNSLNDATSGNNYASLGYHTVGSYWTGSAAQTVSHVMMTAPDSGANPHWRWTLKTDTSIQSSTNGDTILSVSEQGETRFGCTTGGHYRCANGTVSLSPSGVAAGQLRTVSFPDASGTLLLAPAPASSGRVGGEPLAANSCMKSSGGLAEYTILSAGAAPGMPALVAPTTNVGGEASWNSVYWSAYVSGPGKVTVRICNSATGTSTPTATTFTARVIE